MCTSRCPAGTRGTSVHVTNCFRLTCKADNWVLLIMLCVSALVLGDPPATMRELAPPAAHTHAHTHTQISRTHPHAPTHTPPIHPHLSAIHVLCVSALVLGDPPAPMGELAPVLLLLSSVRAQPPSHPYTLPLAPSPHSVIKSLPWSSCDSVMANDASAENDTTDKQTDTR